MSAIKLGPFGGVHPSVGARSLLEYWLEVKLVESISLLQTAKPII